MMKTPDVKPLDGLKFAISQLNNEPPVCNGKRRYSSSIFTRKMPKGVMVCDYDKSEIKAELQLDNGMRIWWSLEDMFGCVIDQNKDALQIIHPEGSSERMKIVGVEQFKIKRTLYWKLVFEVSMPF